MAMSGSDSPTFFHGQPWSSWIEKIGRDKPLSDDEPESEPPSSVMRLSADDIDLYGFCPERDTFYGVVCEICNAIVKPQALIQHMESRHPSGNSTLPPPITTNVKPPLKTPYCKLSKLKKGQTSQLAINNKTNHSALKRSADQQIHLHSTIAATSPRSPNGNNINNEISMQTNFAGSLAGTSPCKSPNTNTGQQKRKRLKTERSLLKDREYDPDKHCGVWNDETGKPCTRSLTCKAHTVSLRRHVTGRSKSFDKLLAEHRASKELPNSKPNSKITVTGNVTVTTDASTVLQKISPNNPTTVVTKSANENESPNSPPVLSLPDSYPLPQVVDLLYQCLAPHGSNKPTKLEEDFASELESGRIDATVVNNNTTASNTAILPQITGVLPSLSPVPTSNISPSTIHLQYNTRNISSPISVEQLISTKQSPVTAPVVPTMIPMNQSLSSTNALEGKTPLDIDSESITMYSPIFKDNKSQMAVQISRSNIITQLPATRNYQSQSAMSNLNIFDGVDQIDFRNNHMIVIPNGPRLSNHTFNNNSMVKQDFLSQDYSNVVHLEPTTAVTSVSSAFENFNDISWSNSHPEPLAVSKWLRITSSRKQYNFNIH